MPNLSQFYPSEFNQNFLVNITGNQTISGIKNFDSRPTVRGTGVLLQGEAVNGGTVVLPNNILFTTGLQTITGPKNFTARPTLSGINLMTTGDLVGLELNILGLIGSGVTGATGPTGPTGPTGATGFGLSIWSGTYANLNDIPNKYPGLITYVSGEQNLYLYKGVSAYLQTSWEKIVKTDVDFTGNNASFTFSSAENGQVIYLNSATNITASLPNSSIALAQMGSGYNVSIVQIGNGQIIFSNSVIAFFRNRLNATTTAGRYAVASILRISNNEFLLYGDVI